MAFATLFPGCHYQGVVGCSGWRHLLLDLLGEEGVRHDPHELLRDRAVRLRVGLRELVLAREAREKLVLGPVVKTTRLSRDESAWHTVDPFNALSSGGPQLYALFWLSRFRSFFCRACTDAMGFVARTLGLIRTAAASRLA